MKKSVLVDMDGILANLFAKWFQFYNRDYNAKLTPGDLTSYSIRDCVPIGASMDAYLGYPGFYRDLALLPGAIEGIGALLEMDLDIFILSSPGKQFGSVPDKALWLDQHFPELHYRKRIFTSAKYQVVGDYLIDDGPENIQAWLERNPKGKALTIAYPYNKCVEKLVSVRAESWNDTAAAWKQITDWIAWHLEAR